jgi:hypothetical protein
MQRQSTISDVLRVVVAKQKLEGSEDAYIATIEVKTDDKVEQVDLDSDTILDALLPPDSATLKLAVRAAVRSITIKSMAAGAAAPPLIQFDVPLAQYRAMTLAALRDRVRDLLNIDTANLMNEQGYELGDLSIKVEAFATSAFLIP